MNCDEIFTKQETGSIFALIESIF